MRRAGERYTVNDMAGALAVAPNAVRRHLRSLGVHSGSGWRHEWDAARYRRLLELVGRRIAEGVPASRVGDETAKSKAGTDPGMREMQSAFEMPDAPAGIEEMQISTFKATCLAVLERVGKTGQPVLVTRFGKPVAQIVAPPSGDWLGAMAGTGRILGDLTVPALDPEEWEALG